MQVTVNGQNSTEIEDSVVERVFKLYPEENLSNRPVLKKALLSGSITFSDLKSECDKILIPWQTLFLTDENHRQQLKHIEETRKDKVSPRLLSKRKGFGNVTSKRIVDRLIRLQNFVTTTTSLSDNFFVGSLKGKSVHSAARQVVKHFEIDQNWFWSPRGKGAALTKLIQNVEAKSINVSRGVLQNKMLPHHKVVQSSVYKNTSGFVIRDEKVPFIFLPNEINPDEVESRQIFTLIYLLVIIGLDQYKYFVEQGFKVNKLANDPISRRIFAITSEVLMPNNELKLLDGEKLTKIDRDELASKFKVSPLALVTTLHLRGFISKSKFEELKPEKYKPGTRKPVRMRPQKISTSVKKFCGKVATSHINGAIQNKTVKNVRAQYLLFGAVNKPGFIRYRKEVSL